MLGRAMIKRPLINEKSMLLIESGFYTFEVDKDVTKDQIKKLVSEKFKVTAVDVKIVNKKGKRKLQRSRRGYYQASGIKKAIVKLKKGQKIALFEQSQPEEEEVTVTTAEGEPVTKIKEKKSLLRGTKIKVEKVNEDKDIEEGRRGQVDVKTSHKEKKK